MPKYARPVDGEGAEGPLAVLGNMVKAGIIRQVRRTPNVGRKAIADALEVAPTTIVPYLGELEAAGLLLADPPKAVRKRGEWVVYRVNDEAVTELYLRLGQEIGEI
ncbi:helix-turn-helix transcriptional regulator [Microbacterium abyssi]|uniref:ArsR/SmtB family transcription factor n=1 Tax=Microbacterium TaxID=33882 RepID=UPI0018894919|nr:helix-turn-helix transcriptional regulator [Microbacterium sp. A18JL241]